MQSRTAKRKRNPPSGDRLLIWGSIRYAVYRMASREMLMSMMATMRRPGLAGKSAARKLIRKAGEPGLKEIQAVIRPAARNIADKTAK